MARPPERPRAKRSLGQHFLVDPNLQRKIVEAIEPEASDTVLEVGPGTGALTQHLAGRVARLVLVELDDALARALVERYAGRADVRVVHGDILELPESELTPGDGPAPKVLGNIPYGITSPLVFRLLEMWPRPRLIVLTVQREVADRLVAEPGTKDYGALTVGVRAVAEVEVLFPVSRHAFRPRPEVDSATVRIRPTAPHREYEERALRRLTRAAFSRRRKQLQKILRQAPEYGLGTSEARDLLRDLGIDPSVRPDALPVADFVRLAAALGRADRAPP